MKKFARNKIISGDLKKELVELDKMKGAGFPFAKGATTVWDHLGLPMTHDDLCEVLIAEYDAEPERCWTEVGQLLREMTVLGLLKEVEE